MSVNRIWALTPNTTFNGCINGAFSFKKQLVILKNTKSLITGSSTLKQYYF